MKHLKKSTESYVIKLGTVTFWFLFWLFNVIDKFVGGSTFLWVGKDRLVQFQELFSSIGIEDPIVASIFLGLVTFAEIVALFLLSTALVSLVQKKSEQARLFFFWGTFTGLAIFSFFAIGDQIFGERHQLLEHTTYWMALVISWGAYTYFPRAK